MSENVDKQKFWKNFDVYKESIPEEILEAAKTIEVKENTLMKTPDKDTNLFYREIKPDNAKSPPFLLLHGASFNSETWLTTGTIQLLGALGHHVIALDIPGENFAISQSKGEVKDKDRELFLQTIVTLVLKLEKPVIISPSRSGILSLPMLTTRPELFSGFIPIAPVITDRIDQKKFPNTQVPTLIVYGSEDTSLGVRSREDLRSLLWSKIVEIPNARHACFIDQTEKWHQILYNFVKQMEIEQSGTEVVVP